MSVPNNFLQAVQTYQPSALAYLENLICFVDNANTRFKDFEKMTANLGDTVTFDLPPRYVTNPSLVATFQPSTQRVMPLTVDQAQNVGIAFDNQQMVFNIDNSDYLPKFLEPGVLELATVIESNVAQNALTHTYRTYTAGITSDVLNPINSFGQLANMVAQYREYGSPATRIKGYLSNLAIPNIVNSGLNQFVLNRNEEIGKSWELGNFDDALWMRSNLLPVQMAGTVGNSQQTLTVISISADGSMITFSGATASDANAIKQNDILTFQDGVSGQPNLRFLTFIGHQVSGLQVQVRATANAAADGGGDVIVSVYPPLNSTVGDPNQNINVPIAAGMQALALPNHRAGLLYAGDALFLAMPQLPDETPFPTSAKYDDDTAISMRMYYGSLFAQNQRGFVLDCIWGSTLVDEYAMRIAFPL